MYFGNLRMTKKDECLHPNVIYPITYVEDNEHQCKHNQGIEVNLVRFTQKFASFSFDGVI